MKESRDILTLFEQLNSHEVFTPPRVAREMLALLPKEIWGDPSIRILDPCVKSGVFLREALYLLIDGLAGKGKYVGHDGIEYDLNDGQQRMNHILKNMLFGIATSELTGYISRRTLYGVMEANTDKQTALIDALEKSKSHKKWTEEEKGRFLDRNRFNEYYDHGLFNTPDYAGFEHEGNIFYPTTEVNKQIDDSGAFIIEDTYYPFIEEQVNHGKIQQIKDGQMKFDVVIGNPPYQVNTSTHGKQAKPIYQHFIQSAISLNPKVITMITPSRWFTGGMGLSDFRSEMMKDKRVKIIHDFANSKECFPGVSISGGVNFFLWEKKYQGSCCFHSHKGDSVEHFDCSLDEYPVVIRNAAASSILKKVNNVKSDNGIRPLSEMVKPINNFDLSSSFRGLDCGEIKVLHSKGEGRCSRSDIRDNDGSVDMYKVVVSRTVAEHANEPSKDGSFKVIAKNVVLPPLHVCTHSYLVVGAFHSEDEAVKLSRFLNGKFARYLILQTLTGIDLSKERFAFVPLVIDEDDLSDESMYKNSDFLNQMYQQLKVQ